MFLSGWGRSLTNYSSVRRTRVGILNPLKKQTDENLMRKHENKKRHQKETVFTHEKNIFQLKPENICWRQPAAQGRAGGSRGTAGAGPRARDAPAFTWGPSMAPTDLKPCPLPSRRGGAEWLPGLLTYPQKFCEVVPPTPKQTAPSPQHDTDVPVGYVTAPYPNSTGLSREWPQ